MIFILECFAVIFFRHVNTVFKFLAVLYSVFNSNFTGIFLILYKSCLAICHMFSIKCIADLFSEMFGTDLSFNVRCTFFFFAFQWLKCFLLQIYCLPNMILMRTTFHLLTTMNMMPRCSSYLWEPCLGLCKYLRLSVWTCIVCLHFMSESTKNPNDPSAAGCLPFSPLPNSGIYVLMRFFLSAQNILFILSLRKEVPDIIQYLAFK